MRKLDVAVLGMGVGGLAAATLLARTGHRVTVFDQMAAAAPVGSGLVIQPTGLEVLTRMDLADAMLARGSRIDRMLGKCQPSGRTVLDVGYGAGRHGLAVQRHALFSILLKAATDAHVDIELGREVVGIAPGEAPEVRFHRHPKATFDLVVDALGSRSPGARTREIGYGALWATVPWSLCSGFDPNTLEQRYRGARQMAGVLPVGTAEEGGAPMATVFWSVRNDDPQDRWRDDAADLWPNMSPLLAAARPVHAIYRHHTRNPHPMSGVVRIGDSWHATSPQLGQGANMALMDALSLATAVTRHQKVDGALVAHVRARRLHIAFYQGLSRILTPFYQSDGRTLPMLRDHLVAPMLRRRGLVHAAIAAMVTGGVLDPIGRIDRMTI